MKPYETEVKRGIKLLDRVRPGWRQKIDPLRLDMDRGCDCILGQIEGHYYDALSNWPELNNRVESAAEYGFSVVPPTKDRFKALTRTWLYALRDEYDKALKKWRK